MRVKLNVAQKSKLLKKEEKKPASKLSNVMNNDLQGRIHMEAGKLTIIRISLLDSGMYQCVAHNEHGSVYASAELKVVGKQMILPSSHTAIGEERGET